MTTTQAQTDWQVAENMERWLTREWQTTHRFEDLLTLQTFRSLVRGEIVTDKDYQHLATTLYPHTSRYALSRLGLWRAFGLERLLPEKEVSK